MNACSESDSRSSASITLSAPADLHTTGMTLLNYLLQWRIAVAENMPAREQMSVAETAPEVGYQSASGFSTAFSRETGRSPKEFIGVQRGDK